MKSKEEIAKDNDLFRTTMLIGAAHKIVFTPGAAEYWNRASLLSAIQKFNKFTPANDPHSEHDFGIVDMGVGEFYWKIDYYDSSYEYGVNPKEGPVCRLMTIMRASEY